MDRVRDIPDEQKNTTDGDVVKLSIVIPCYNEEATLKTCVERVRRIADEALTVEIIIVDDASTDNSLEIGKELEAAHPEISIFTHDVNRGKGAALRTGFKKATGDFVAVQDADLEYDPQELPRLLIPLRDDHADVVIGSRFLSAGAHRVLYFWHYLGNRFLTFVSNMFTDLNLTDMETCYKVFRRDVIQRIDVEENRFGFEPEIIAKVARMRLRIFEMGISYHGRTYDEGKKIGARDGFRALYCIIRYNAHKAPPALQFVLYLLIGGVAGVVDVIAFSALYYAGSEAAIAAPVAFLLAAIINYFLCILLLFRRQSRWGPAAEQLVYWLFASVICAADLGATLFFIRTGLPPPAAKLLACIIPGPINFIGRRFLVFSDSEGRTGEARDAREK